jgi:hypothetical protein
MVTAMPFSAVVDATCVVGWAPAYKVPVKPRAKPANRGEMRSTMDLLYVVTTVEMVSVQSAPCRSPRNP